MTRKEFNEKHEGAIKSIATANNVDMGVGSDMLVSSLRGFAGETYKDPNGEHTFEIYKGIPEGFNLRTAYEDYKEMVRG